MSHPCRVPDCVRPAKDGQLMCWPHWRGLPRALKLAIVDTYRRGQRDAYGANVEQAVRLIKQKEKPSMIDIRVGTGPFTVAKTGAIINDTTPRATVLDQIGEPFCYVLAEDCHGGDLAAARARATLIAEQLSRYAVLRAALVKAREIIQTERNCVVECATIPPKHDLATLDDQTRPFVETYDAALAQIDEALR